MTNEPNANATTGTYFDRALEDEAGGRWARHAKAHVTGSGQPDPLPAPEWSRAQARLPDEAPIDFAADSALPDMDTLSGLPREALP
jgi:hypothetical protein